MKTVEDVKDFIELQEAHREQMEYPTRPYRIRLDETGLINGEPYSELVDGEVELAEALARIAPQVREGSVIRVECYGENWGAREAGRL